MEKEDIKKYEQDTESLPVLLAYTLLTLIGAGLVVAGSFLFS